MLSGRKRKSRLDSYLDDLDKDPEIVDKRRHFFTDLHLFYRRKWNCPVKIPHVNGCALDLYQLYKKVTSMGGWYKVSNAGRWPDVLEAMEISGDAAIAEHAIKFIYSRYLSKFEQYQFLGEDTDRDEEAASVGGTRSRGKSYMSSLVSSVVDSPAVRNHHVPENMRTALGLTPQTVKATPYDRLIRSLQSGLPNEVDYAVNVCMLLSHPGPKFLRLNTTTPSPVLDLLLAQAGVFVDGPGSYRELYEEQWRHTTKRRFADFWHAGLANPDAEEARLMLGPSDTPSHPRLTNVDTELFAGLTPEFNPNEAVTARVTQIASIVRNLSFETPNKAPMAASRTLLKFLHVCIHSKYTMLQNMALDTLSNIASEISLSLEDSEATTLHLFRTLSRCLNSEDKFHVIRALETLAALCTKERNETVLCEFLDAKVLQKILALVAVRDIMMCVYVLECIYQISEMGPVTCQRIAEQPRAVDVLVDLATIEAVSFGPAGLMGMKVVEYGPPQPHTALMSHPPSSSNVPAPSPSQPSPAAAAAPLSIQSSPMRFASPPPPLIPQTKPHQMLLPPSTGQLPHPHSAIPNNNPAAMFQVPLSTSRGPTASPVLPNSPVAYRGPAVTVHQDEEVEHRTLAWIRDNCVQDPHSSVSRGELYAQYVADMHKVQQSLAVSANTFSTLLRQAFPACNIRKAEDGNARFPLMHVDGIKFVPRSIAPIVSGPPPPPPQGVTAQHPLVHQMLSHQRPLVPDPSVASFRSPASNSEVGAKHPQLANRLLAPVCSNALGTSRPGSVDTPDDSLSGPPTPESLISGASSPAPSPKSATAMNGTKKHPLSSRSEDSKSPPLPMGTSQKLPPNCHLEVCEQAHEAKHLIDTGDNHEARILRVENTAAVPPAPATNTIDTQINTPAAQPPAPTIPPPPPTAYHAANGELTNENHTPEPKLKMDGQIDQTTTMNGKDHEVQKHGPVNGLIEGSGKRGGKGRKKSEGTDESATAEDADQKKKRLTALLSESIELVASGGNEDNSMDTPSETPATPAERSSESPDTESMTQNLNQCQAIVQELIGAAEEAKKAEEMKTEMTETEGEDAEEALQQITVAAAAEDQPEAMDETPVKAATKKKKKKKKESVSDSNESPKPSPKKKKKPAGPKTPKTTRSAAKGNNNINNNNNNGSQEMNHNSSSAQKRPCPNPTSDSPDAKRMAVQAPMPGVGPMPVPMPGRPLAPPPNLKFMCEWNGCGKTFVKPSLVYYHVAMTHINESTINCKWPHCDKTVRGKWSLTTHVQDVHCNDMVLKAASLRRYEIQMTNFSNIPEPKSPPPHPGYSQNAAIEAIRRHALNFLPRDITEENEGPVTKSIRLTSCLILRNLARFSAEGRRVLKRYERHLASLAFSKLESSSALAQCLAELSQSGSPRSPSKAS